MAVGDIWKCVVSSLYIRSGPGTSYDSVGGLVRGDTVTETERRNDSNGTMWVKHSKGWSCSTHLTIYKRASGEVTESTDNSPADDEEGSGYQPDIGAIMDSYDNVNYNVSDSEFVKIKNVAGVFGLPYQFLPNTDLRLSGDKKTENIGYEYAEKIIERIPLLFISPGRASFMTKYSKENKKNLLEWMISNGAGNEGGSLEDILNSDGKYYTFEYDRARYYNYVNPMCRIAARYLGLDGVKINGSKLDTMNWETFTQHGIKNIGDFGDFGAIPFYIDTDTSVQESFGNSTTQSTLASTVNGISDMGRELNFLLGYGASATGAAVLTDADVAQNIQNVQDTVNKLLGTGNFLSNLANHLTTVASGGKLIFPEIWNDSNFSRSYSCEFKFISPDPSKLSVYLNVLVPLFHLLALVAPHTVDRNPNGYTNPFLVRAIYKGFFNVDMGIITDMSVTRGAECQWTPEGIPTSISVNISIKDLYSAMSITGTDNKNFKYDTLNNTALMDYIANLCGINIYRPEIARILDMWFVNNFTNRAQDFWQTDIWAGIQNRVQNLIMGIYR